MSWKTSKLETLVITFEITLINLGQDFEAVRNGFVDILGRRDDHLFLTLSIVFLFFIYYGPKHIHCSKSVQRPLSRDGNCILIIVLTK